MHSIVEKKNGGCLSLLLSNEEEIKMAGITFMENGS